MGIFSRKDNGRGRHRAAGRATTNAVPGEKPEPEDELEPDAAETGAVDAETDDAAPEEETRDESVEGSPAVTTPSGPIDRSEGPYDESEVDGLAGRLDLGGLWIAGRPGMELRVEVDQETQTIVGVTAAVGSSAVQLQAFAAPKSSGIWDEVRGEIVDSIVSQGGSAEEVDGLLGLELQTRMPGRGSDGRTVFSPVRFVGVDGPRWFLRAVLSGAAGSDPDEAARMMELVKETVVVRGPDAMAPRELLELRLPAEVTGEGAEGEAGEDGAAGADDADAEGNRPSADDLNPFERGPEITETR